MGTDTMYVMLSPTTTEHNLSERRAALRAALPEFEVANELPLRLYPSRRWPSAFRTYHAESNLAPARALAERIPALYPDAVVLAMPDTTEVLSLNAEVLVSHGAVPLDEFIAQIEVWFADEARHAEADEENTQPLDYRSFTREELDALPVGSIIAEVWPYDRDAEPELYRRNDAGQRNLPWQCLTSSPQNYEFDRTDAAQYAGQALQAIVYQPVPDVGGAN